LERKQHSQLSRIVKACCNSNNANQCPGRYMQDKEKGGSKQCVWRCMHFQSRLKVYQYISGGGGMYQYIISPPTGFLLLNLENLGRGMEETRMFCLSPSNFVSENFSGTSLFCQEASANKPIQVKPALLSLFVLDWTQWGSLLVGCLKALNDRQRLFYMINDLH
jgi:hypothetical protein